MIMWIHSFSGPASNGYLKNWGMTVVDVAARHIHYYSSVAVGFVFILFLLCVTLEVGSLLVYDRQSLLNLRSAGQNTVC